MPAVKCNYLVLYRGDSQVYASANRDIALASAPPEGFTIEDKMILFVTQQPDTDELIVKPLPRQEILDAELQEPKPKKKKASDEQDTQN